jgi:hypothetical protein
VVLTYKPNLGSIQLCVRLEHETYGSPPRIPNNNNAWSYTSIPKGTWNQEWGSYTWDFEWWMKEGSRNGASLSEGAPWEGPGGRAPFLGTLKDTLSKVLEWTSVYIGAPRLGKMEGRSFLRAFEITRYINRYVKMPCKRISLSIGAPLGNLEVIRLPGLLERKV